MIDPAGSSSLTSSSSPSLPLRDDASSAALASLHDESVHVASQYRLSVLRQPPSVAFADKMLKPPPLLHLECPPSTHLNVLCVEVSLVRSDTRAEIGRGLTGVTIVAFNNGPNISFSKLKILALRSQMGSAFQLKFVLKKHAKHTLRAFSDVVAFSSDIDVVEGSLTRRSASHARHAPPSFEVDELIPRRCRPGAEFVLLARVHGTNLTQHLKLLLADQEIPFYCQDPGVFLCSVPVDSRFPKDIPLKISSVLNGHRKEHDQFNLVLI